MKQNKHNSKQPSELSKLSQAELVALVEKNKSEISQLNLKLNRYGLTWNKELDQDSVFNFFKSNFPVLEHIKDKQIGEGINTLFEGDNLPTLILLSLLKKKEFDIASFDPPYNTGQTFTYVDNFKIKSFNEEDADFSSKWINMMVQRLILIQQCLKDDGLCVINIDEFERANLELISRMIFPQFIGDLIWKKNAPKNNSRTVSFNHEYILAFGNKDLKSLNHVEKPNHKIILAKLNEYINLKGKKIVPFEVEKVLKSTYPDLKKSDIGMAFPELKVEMTEQVIQASFKNWMSNQDFPPGDTNFETIDFEKRDLFRGSDLSAPGGKGKQFKVKHPVTGKECNNPSRGWAVSEETFERMAKNGEVLFGADEKIVPKKKLYFSDASTAPLDSVINEPRNGLKDLEALGFDKKVFDFPKPVNLIKTLLKLKNKDAKCLDIFAGSGTLGQAVIELNDEDGGSRTFVLATNNENGICERITYERVKRVMTGHVFSKENKGKSKENSFKAIPDRGLAYFRIHMINRSSDQEQFKSDLGKKIKDLLKYKESVFTEVKDKHLILESETKRVIFQQGADVKALEKAIIDSDKTVVLYLNDIKASQLSAKAKAKLDRIEEGLLDAIAAFDVDSLHL